MHCVYKNCRLGCGTKSQHKSRYATMRTNGSTIQKTKKSDRLNYEVLRNLLQTGKMLNLKATPKVIKHE